MTCFLIVIQLTRSSNLLKKDISNLKTNHIKHLHEDVEKIDSKIDTVTSWIIYGLGTFAVVLLGQLLYIFSN